MHNVLAFLILVPMLIACTNGTSQQATSQDSAVAHVDVVEQPTSEARKLFDPLVEKYPNYKSNEIAQAEMSKSIEEYFTSLIGKPFTFLNDLPVEFEEIDQFNGDTATVWFKTPDYSSYGGDKWDIVFRLLVETSKDEAAKLASGRYHVNGTLKKWDKKGRFTGTGFLVSSTIWLGTFVITDANIKEL